MCKVQMLRALVEQRLTAAAEEIFGLFERTIAEYEEELCRSKEENERQRELLDAVFNPQLRVHRAVTMQPAGRRSLCTAASSTQTPVDAVSVECRKEPEPPPHIKEEQEELWSSQEEGRMYRHVDQIPFTLVSGASEYGDYMEETVQPAGRRSRRTAASSTQTPALPPDNKSQIVIKEEQQECSCSVDQQEPELPPNIKEEQEELWSSREEGLMQCHIDQIPFTLVSRASEYGDYDEDVEQLVEEDIPPEQQDCSSSVDQEEPEVPPNIKEEQEEPWSSHEGEQLQGLEEADITKFPFTPVPVKSEDDEEDALSSQLHQRLTQHMETEADGEDCGGPEPARNLRPHPLLQPETEDQTGDSSEPETNDSADWKETREPQSISNSLKHRSILKKRFSCSECGRRFCHKPHLKRHLITHTVEKPFRCSQCGKSFTESFFLKIHMTTHSEQKHFSCSECGKAFPDCRNLKNHMMTHSGGEKPFSCSVCKKSFTRRGRLRSHMAVHTGEKRSPKPFSCSDCGNRFGTKAHLKRHMRTHTGEKPFSCSECGKAFSDNGNLKKHLMTHTGEKPFSCPVCNRRFVQRIHFKTHKCVGQMETEADGDDCGGLEPARNSHPLLQPETGDLQPATGDLQPETEDLQPETEDLQPETEDLQPETEDQTGCSSEPETDDSADWKETREPQSASNSLKHDLRCKKTFSCSECGKRFGCKAHLRRHAEIHREKRFSCRFCNERFAWRAQFQEHKCVGRQTEENREAEPPSHPHPLLQPETLNSVKQDSGCKKTFICSECGRRFGNKGTLRRHIMTHTGEKPFSCSVCNKSFTQKGTLQKHIMIHTEEKSYSCPVCNTSFIQRGNLQQHMVVHMRERIQPPCL